MSSPLGPNRRSTKVLPTLHMELEDEFAVRPKAKSPGPIVRDCKTLPTLEMELDTPAPSLRLAIQLAPSANESAASAAMKVVKEPSTPRELMSALGQLLDLGAIDSIRVDAS